MKLKQESFVILFIIIVLIRILLKSTPSKHMIMLTFDYVKGWSLTTYQLHEVSIRKALFWASVKQSKFKIETVKPCFEVLPVLLDINQYTVGFYLLIYKYVKY